MKIKIDRPRNTVRYDELNYACVFEYDGAYYMPITTPPYNSFNAIDLSDGHMVSFNDNTLVVPHPEAVMEVDG